MNTTVHETMICVHSREHNVHEHVTLDASREHNVHEPVVWAASVGFGHESREQV